MKNTAKWRSPLALDDPEAILKVETAKTVAATLPTAAAVRENLLQEATSGSHNQRWPYAESAPHHNHRGEVPSEWGGENLREIEGDRVDWIRLPPTDPSYPRRAPAPHSASECVCLLIEDSSWSQACRWLLLLLLQAAPHERCVFYIHI